MESCGNEQMGDIGFTATRIAMEELSKFIGCEI